MNLFCAAFLLISLLFVGGSGITNAQAFPGWNWKASGIYKNGPVVAIDHPVLEYQGRTLPTIGKAVHSYALQNACMAFGFQPIGMMGGPVKVPKQDVYFPGYTIFPLEFAGPHVSIFESYEEINETLFCLFAYVNYSTNYTRRETGPDGKITIFGPYLQISENQKAYLSPDQTDALLCRMYGFKNIGEIRTAEATAEDARTKKLMSLGYNPKTSPPQREWIGFAKVHPPAVGEKYVESVVCYNDD